MGVFETGHVSRDNKAVSCTPKWLQEVFGLTTRNVSGLQKLSAFCDAKTIFVPPPLHASAQMGVHPSIQWPPLLETIIINDISYKYPPLSPNKQQKVSLTFLFLLTDRKYVLWSPQYGGAHDLVSSPPSTVIFMEISYINEWCNYNFIYIVFTWGTLTRHP